MTNETDAHAEQISQMREQMRREHEARAGQPFWLPYGPDRWATYIAVAIAAAFAAAGVWVVAVELPASIEKSRVDREQRRAIYDRYMTECLQDHREYECVKLLWDVRP